MRRYLHQILLVAFSVATSAFAYDINDFVREAKAHHAKHQDALNGVMLEVRGEITQPKQDVFTIDATYYARGSQWRTDATLFKEGSSDGFPLTVLFDGQQVWAKILGMKLKVPRGDVDDRVRGYLYWEEPAAGSVLVGEEYVQGRLCRVITTPLKESNGKDVTMTSWYDKEHFVLVQSESTLDSKPVRMEFSDFREVRAGYVIPHELRAVQDGAQIFNARIASVASGSAVSNALFDSAQLGGENFPDMSALMRTMKIFGSVFTNEVSKLLQGE